MHQSESHNHVEHSTSFEDSFVPELVKEKPKKSVKLSIVVPIYAEYSNGNVFRLIESFAKQAVDANSYEVLCLVNNTPEASQAQTQDYEENQLTLAVGRYLRGEGPLPEGLNKYRQAVLEIAKKYRIPLQMIDLSTAGVEKNIGMIRDIGLHEAIRRFQVNGQRGEGIIAQLDADTVIEPKYAEKILDHFSNPRIDSLFITLDYYIPEGTEKLFKTSFHHQHKMAFDQWINILDKQSVTVGGPQTIARAKAYESVGGIAHQDMAEDFALAKSLSSTTNYKFGTDTRVYTSDRARGEGYDARMRLEKMTGEEQFRYKNDITRMKPALSFMKRELEVAAETTPDIFSSEEQLKLYFDKYNVPFDYAKFKASVLDKPSKLSEREISFVQKVAIYMQEYFEAMNIQTNVGSNEYVNETINILKKYIESDEITRLNELIKENTIRFSTRLNEARASIAEAVNLVYKNGKISLEDFSSNPKTEEFLERNPWLLEKFNNLPNLYSSAGEALEALKQEFPEWVEKFENSRLRRSTALLHALTAYFREVENTPDQYPSAKEFLEKIKR